MESSSSDSGSVQCSGGGDHEEFDPRSESFSSFLNNHAHGDLGSIRQPRIPSHHENHQSSSLYDLCNFTQSTTQPQTPTSFLNLDMVLSGGGGGGGGGGFTSAPPPPPPPPTSSSQWPWSSPQQIQPCGTTSLNPSSSILPSESRPSASNVVKHNPKKRSRASRRAPTTVLTTDTSNFRAMVQEFTGIPAPPFSASAFLGSRLNLFSTSSLLRSGMEAAAAATSITPYPLRPSAASFLPSAPLTNTSNPSNTTYQHPLPSDQLGLTRQSVNFLNMETPPGLTFPSFFQSSPPPNASSTFGTKSQTYNSTSDTSTLETFHLEGQLSTNHLGNAGKSLNDQWGVIGERD